MSMIKRKLEDAAYEYLVSHPDLEIEEVIVKMVEGEILYDEETK